MANFKQELRKKLLISFSIIAVILAGMFFLGWDINQRAEDIKIARQELANRSAKLSLFAQLQSQATQAESYASVLKNVLPDHDQLFDFPKELERLAKQINAGFGFSFGTETPSTPIQLGRLQFTVTVQGVLSKIIDFIKNVEASRFSINFKSFDFNNSAADINGEVLFN
jgi:hypothetical protein